MKRSAVCLTALTVLLTFLLASCGLGGKENITSAKDLNDSRYTIGVDQGSASDLIAEELFPEARFEYFPDKFMGYRSVADGKIDAFVYDHRQMEIAIENGLSGVRLLDEKPDKVIDIAVGLSPVSGIDGLEEKINAFIAELRADGTLDDMFRRWVSDGVRKMPDIPKPASPTEHLTVGTSGIVEPFSYYGEDGLTGYDIELALRFAAWLNADLEFEIYDYGSIVAAAQSGDVDCIMADLNVTKERRQELPFSDILYSESAGIMVRDENSTASLPEYASFEELEGCRIGVLTGSEQPEMVRAAIPTAQIEYYNGSADLYQALKSHKVEAFSEDEVIIRLMTAGDESVSMIPSFLDETVFAFAFPMDDEGEALRAEISRFVRSKYEDGTIDELHEI